VASADNARAAGLLRTMRASPVNGECDTVEYQVDLAPSPACPLAQDV
jgi:hypothetical protein